MGQLDDALSKIRGRIVRYQEVGINEQNTKAALIEPVLRSLGWDLEDLEEVQREYRPKSADKPVDYALLILKCAHLFLEAKALGENLDDRRWANQIMGYAAVAGVEWVVLTNGNEYRIYNAHAPVPVEDKLFRKVKVSDEETHPVDALLLLSKQRLQENRLNDLWRAHFIDRQVRTAIEALSIFPIPAIQGSAVLSVVQSLPA